MSRCLIIKVKFQRLLVAFLCAFTIASIDGSAAVPDLPVDRAAHFGLSVVATATTIRLGQLVTANKRITWKNRVISSFLVFGAGFAKEVSDKKKKGDHYYDVGDLNADGAGVLYGNILMIEF